MDHHRRLRILHEIHELLNLSKKGELLSRLSAPFPILTASDRPLVEYYACLLLPSEKSHDFLLFFLLNTCHAPAEACYFFSSSTFLKISLLEQDYAVIRRYLNRFILMRAVHASLPKYLQRQDVAWRRQCLAYENASTVIADRNTLLGLTPEAIILTNSAEHGNTTEVNSLHPLHHSVDGEHSIPPSSSMETEPFRLHRRMSFGTDSSILGEYSLYEHSPINTPRSANTFFATQERDHSANYDDGIKFLHVEDIQEPSLISMDIDHEDQAPCSSSSSDEFWDVLDVNLCPWALKDHENELAIEGVQEATNIEPKKTHELQQHKTETIPLNGSGGSTMVNANSTKKIKTQYWTGNDHTNTMSMADDHIQHGSHEEGARATSELPAITYEKIAQYTKDGTNTLHIERENGASIVTESSSFLQANGGAIPLNDDQWVGHCPSDSIMVLLSSSPDVAVSSDMEVEMKHTVNSHQGHIPLGQDDSIIHTEAISSIEPDGLLPFRPTTPPFIEINSEAIKDKERFNAEQIDEAVRPIERRSSSLERGSPGKKKKRPFGRKQSVADLSAHHAVTETPYSLRERPVQPPKQFTFDPLPLTPKKRQSESNLDKETPRKGRTTEKTTPKDPKIKVNSEFKDHPAEKMSHGKRTRKTIRSSQSTHHDHATDSSSKADALFDTNVTEDTFFRRSSRHEKKETFAEPLHSISPSQHLKRKEGISGSMKSPDTSKRTLLSSVFNSPPPPPRGKRRSMYLLRGD